MKRMHLFLLMTIRNLQWLNQIMLMAGTLWLTSCEEVMDVSFTGSSAKNLVVDGVITRIPHPTT